MRALLYSAVGKVEMTELPMPEAGPGEVRVRVRATGICGSDVHGFLGHQARRQPGLVLGHETTGAVDQVGAGVDASLIGQRVAVNPLLTCCHCRACRTGRQNCCPTWRLLGMDRTNGGFAEAVVVPARNVQPLPESVTDAQAVMIEPLANAFHILSKIPSDAGLLPEAVILGGGTLGACILSVAKARGLRVVAVSEPNPQRGEVARRLGAEAVVGPDRIEEFAGVPVVIDAVGRAATRQAAAKVVGRGGTALLLGLDEGPTTLDFQDLVRREVRLQGSFAYNDGDFEEAAEFVKARRVDLTPWTDTVHLSEGQAAFDRLVNDPADRLKIALIP